MDNNFLIDTLFLAFIFWLGFTVGKMVMAYQMREIIYDQARKNGIIIDDGMLQERIKEVEAKTKNLMIEKHGNMLLLYEVSTNTFICQGSTVEELAKLSKSYKNIDYAVVENGDDTLLFVNGYVKTTV